LSGCRKKGEVSAKTTKKCIFQCFCGTLILPEEYETLPLQVNLFQKLSFLNQLTQNMTRDCHWIPRKIQVHNMLCTKIVSNVKTKTKQFLCTTCCELVFFGKFNEQSLVILWVNWCKNEGFWKRFTYTIKFCVTLYLPLTTFLLDNVGQTMRWTLGPCQQNTKHHHRRKKNAWQSCTQ
jgi:hypothetical protein